MFTKTESGEIILWHLLEKDAQEIAKELIDRKLTTEELQDVERGLDIGFEKYWYDTLDEAVRIAIEESEFQKAR
ncbi:hypothetical protein ES703_08232 [subsurface metagenome]